MGEKDPRFRGGPQGAQPRVLSVQCSRISSCPPPQLLAANPLLIAPHTQSCGSQSVIPLCSQDHPGPPSRHPPPHLNSEMKRKKMQKCSSLR